MDRTLYAEHDELERWHWWFVARRRIVMAVLGDRLGPRHRRVLDVGCGTGGTLEALRSLRLEAVGLEPDPEAAEIARGKSGVEVRVGSLPDDIPWPDRSFDVVTALDVVEHVGPDTDALVRILALLRPGGIFLCTVPACPLLWSEHDVRNRHYRRYSRAELRSKITAAGFAIDRLSYYNTLLFPAVAAVRSWQKLAGRPGGSDFRRPGRRLNRLLESLFAAERHALRVLPLPIGVSLLAVARRPG